MPGAVAAVRAASAHPLGAVVLVAALTFGVWLGVRHFARVAGVRYRDGLAGRTL